MQDATTKSLVFSQFVNFLDLIAYRLQKAGFTVGNVRFSNKYLAQFSGRYVAWKAQ
jgi:hypothetical protein